MCFRRHLHDGKTQARAGGRRITRSGLVHAEESFERTRNVEISQAGPVVLYFQDEFVGAFADGDPNVPARIRELQGIVSKIPHALAQQALIEKR